MSDTMSTLQQLCIWALPVLFAITVHEAAHGWVADRLGDHTAKLLGRVTLNPLKHIDWIGTVLVPVVLLLTTSFVFGWAKPVPVNWLNLKHPRRDAAWVAAAGPSVNLLMAFVWAGVAKIGWVFWNIGTPAAFLIAVGKAGIAINVLLGLLNLIPIPPLDGSRVVASLLPQNVAIQYEKISPFGFIILLVLLFSGALMSILMTPYTWITDWIYQIFSMV